MSHKPIYDFLYLLRRTDTGDYVYIDPSGALAYTATPTALVYTPNGWQTKSIAWERDIKKWGLVRTFSLPLTFVKDGATAISTLALSSFETPLELLIKQLTLAGQSPHTWSYVDLYIGTPDLSKVEGTETGISAPMIEGGLEQQVKANEDTVYEIEFDDYKTVKMDGTVFKNVANFVNPGIGAVSYGNYILPVSFISRDGTEGTGSGLVCTTSDIEQLPNGILANTDFSTRTNYFLYAVQATTIRLKGSVAFDKTGSMWFAIKSNRNITYFDNAFAVYSGPSTISFDLTISLSAGEGLFMYSGQALSSTYWFDSSFTVSYDYRYKTTPTKGFTPYVLFQKLVEKMTGNVTNAQSTMLQSFDNIIITSQDAVRGIAGAKVKTSFSQFMQFVRAQFVAGYEVSGGKVVVRPISDLSSVATPIAMGQCKGFKWSFATDMMFNSIKVGYPARDTDDVNGKYAFNNTQVWTIDDVTKVASALDLTCPYLADPILIELKRLNLEGQTTTDDSTDNTIFLLNTAPIANGTYTTSFGTFLSGNIVQINNGFPDIDLFRSGAKFTIAGSTSNNGTFTVLDSFKTGTNDLWVFVAETVTAEGPVSIGVAYGTVALKRVTYTNTDTGVPDIASLFNIEYLTPKRMLIRWLTYINSCLFQFAGSAITFQSTDKNRELKTDDGSVIVDEDATLTIGTTRWFKAINFQFDVPVGTTVPTTLQATPNVGISTVWNGNTWLGILMKGAMAPNTRAEQTYKLLAGPGTNESLLANA
jgi:hypothetical protein